MSTTRAFFVATGVPSTTKHGTAILTAYREKFREFAKQYGAKPIDPEEVGREGADRPFVLACLEFPSKQHIKDLFANPKYVEEAVPLRKEAFLRVIASAIEIPADGSAMLAVGGIPTKDGTIQEYIAQAMELATKEGAVRVENAEVLVDEGLEPDIVLKQNFALFPSGSGLKEFFASEKYRAGPMKVRPTAFTVWKGVCIE